MHSPVNTLPFRSIGTPQKVSSRYGQMAAEDLSWQGPRRKPVANVLSANDGLNKSMRKAWCHFVVAMSRWLAQKGKRALLLGRALERVSAQFGQAQQEMGRPAPKVE